MQVLPSTYEWLAKINGEIPFTSALYDPDTNIKYGTYYLQYLYSKFGTWEKALVAYNWGEGRLADFIEENGYEEGDYTLIPLDVFGVDFGDYEGHVGVHTPLR